MLFNLFRECILCGLIKDAVQEILREQVERLGADHLAGISQDTARVCTKAWKLLAQDLQATPGFHRVQYIQCGEHVGQLINQDMAKILPWLKDLGGLVARVHFVVFSDAQALLLTRFFGSVLV